MDGRELLPTCPRTADRFNVGLRVLADVKPASKFYFRAAIAKDSNATPIPIGIQ